MPTPINPYVASNPMGEVLRVLRRPQDNAIVLYGQRRIGKTSILQHLAAQLPKEGPYRPVYFDLQDKAAWPLGRVLGDLARTIAHALGRADPDLGSDPETTFRQMWLTALLSNLPEGSSLMLLLDEFDVRLHMYRPAATRPRLVQALLAQAQVAKDDNEQFALYGQVLELEPAQPKATNRIQRFYRELEVAARQARECDEWKEFEWYHNQGAD
jgi:hypothetical protein